MRTIEMLWMTAEYPNALRAAANDSSKIDTDPRQRDVAEDHLCLLALRTIIIGFNAVEETTCQ